MEAKNQPTCTGKALFALIAILLLVTACKLTEYNKDPNDGETKVSEKAQIIDSADFQSFFHTLDSSAMTIRMDPLIANVYELKPGNFIISDRGRGLLRKIKSVEEKEGELIITTEPTGLAQVLEKGNFEFTQNLSSKISQSQIICLDPGVKLIPDLKGSDNMTMKFSLEVNLASNITVKGELTLNPTISARMDIDYATLNYLKVEFQLIEKFELSAKTTLAQYKLEKEKSIVKVRFPTFTVMAGPVPVVVTPQFELKLGVSLDLKSELSVSAMQELTLTSGIEYDGEWKPYFAEDHGFGRNGPVLTNSAEAKIYIKPQIDMLIYNVVSPNLSTELYGLVEAELGATPWWSLYAGLSGNIGCDVTVFDYELAKFEGQLFDLRFLVAEASSSGDDPPMADFTVSPDSGDVTTNFRFDASNCRDIQDSPDELQVRWDWEGNGTYDTDFSTSKKPTNRYLVADIYHPILEVKDTDGNTSQKTLEIKVAAIPNRKPKALFTIDPPTGAHYETFTFDAGECSDFETPVDQLIVQWDWDNDGNFDTPYSPIKQITHQFFIGNYQITLRVSDEEGYVDTETHTLIVFEGNTLGSLTDTRDSHTYRTVRIGDQWWMAENLNAGFQISKSSYPANNQKIEKYCYNDDEANCQIYGGLYNWNEIMGYTQTAGTRGICPEGWHLPSDDDWEKLATSLGGKQFAGSKMMEAGVRHWGRGNDQATNTSGFTALPGGWYQFNSQNSGAFYGLGTSAYFWSSTLKGEDFGEYYGMSYHILHRETSLVHAGGNTKIGYSVRCVKDS